MDLLTTALGVLADNLPAVLVAGLTFMIWQIGVIIHRPEPQLHSLKEPTPEEALKRAKRRRVAAEHEQWDAELAAITPDKCPHCAGPKRHYS